MPWRSAAPAAPLRHAFFFTVRPDGSGLWRVPAVPSDFGAHLDFGPAGRLLLCQGKAAFLIEVRGVLFLEPIPATLGATELSIRLRGTSPTLCRPLLAGISNSVAPGAPLQNRRGVTLLAKPRPLLAATLGSCRFAPGGARHVLGETQGSSKEAPRVFVWDLERRDAFIGGCQGRACAHFE